MSQGWFKLHRELFEKAIWQESTPEQKVILITLLGMANHQGKEWEWKGKQFKAKPGQFVTSSNSIINKCGKGITEQKLRTALKKFVRYGFLTDETTKVNRLITIVNWGLYQGGEDKTNEVFNEDLTNNQQTSNEPLTNHQQTPNKHLTTNKNVKNDKNVNNEKNGEKEEEIPQPPSIPSNLSKIQKLILDSFGETAYKTWFLNTKITEQENEVEIIATSNFIAGMITQKYKDMLEKLCGKKIIIKGD